MIKIEIDFYLSCEKVLISD